MNLSVVYDSSGRIRKCVRLKKGNSLEEVIGEGSLVSKIESSSLSTSFIVKNCVVDKVNNNGTVEVKQVKYE